jgi:hypothetical protein
MTLIPWTYGGKRSRVRFTVSCPFQSQAVAGLGRSNRKRARRQADRDAMPSIMRPARVPVP